MEPTPPRKSSLKSGDSKPRKDPVQIEESPSKKPASPKRMKKKVPKKRRQDIPRASGVQTKVTERQDAATGRDRSSSMKSDTSDTESTKSRVSFSEDIEYAKDVKKAIVKNTYVTYVESRHEFLNRQHLLSGKKRKLPTWMAFITYLSYMLFTYPFNFGYSFANAGYIAATVLSSFAWIIGTITQHLLLFLLSKLHNQQGDITRFDLSEVVRFTFLYGRGSKYKKFASVSKKVTDLLLIVFIVLHGFSYFDTATMIFEKILVQEDFVANKYKMRTMMFTPMWLLSVLGDLRLLFPLNLISLMLTIIAMLVSKAYVFEPGSVKAHFSAFSDTWTGYAKYFSRFFYGMSAIPILTYLRNEMQNPQALTHRFGIINVGMTIHFSISLFFACTSYFRYGKYMLPMLVDNFPEKEPTALAIRFLICIASLFHFVAILYIPYQIMLPTVMLQVKNAKGQLVMELLIRASLIILVTTLTIVRKVGQFIWMIYNITMCGIIIIFLPGFLVYFNENPKDMPIKTKIYCYSMMFAGVFTSLFGFVDACINIFMF